MGTCGDGCDAFFRRNWDPENEKDRTPCIRVVDVNARKPNKGVRDYRDLLPARALFLLKNGSFDSDRWQISHMCTTEQTGLEMSSCMNDKHMRLEPKKVGNSRQPHQKAIRKHRQSRDFQFKKGQSGPLFLTDTGAAKNCEHRITDRANPDFKEDDAGTYPCFMNIIKINRKPIYGHYWGSNKEDEPHFRGSDQTGQSAVEAVEAKLCQK